jgi:hypothetical protein
MPTAAPANSGQAVAIDFGQFVAANGASYAPSVATPAVSEAGARKAALATATNARVVTAETGILTWQQSRIDHRQVWLVSLAVASTDVPTEYVFVDANDGIVLWQFGRT